MTMHDTTGLQLRHAQAADAPLLLSILQAAFEEYREHLDPPSGVHHETADTILQKLNKGNAILAYLNGEAIGCVFYQPEEDFVYLGRLSVLPRYRKLGAARALIQAVEQQARQRGIYRVQLGVRIALPVLHAYYSRIGYRTVRYGVHDGYAEPTYMIMEKDLE